MDSISLINKTCIPCAGGTKPLDRIAIYKLLSEIGGGWDINKSMHLYKEYKFNDFMSPMRFANKVAEIAEAEGHHPNLSISWGMLTVEIWTHKINGLTESDFILAAKIDAIL